MDQFLKQIVDFVTGNIIQFVIGAFTSFVATLYYKGKKFRVEAERLAMSDTKTPAIRAHINSLITEAVDKVSAEYPSITVFDGEKGAEATIVEKIRDLAESSGEAVIKATGARFSSSISSASPRPPIMESLAELMQSPSPRSKKVQLLLAHPDSCWIDVRCEEKVEDPKKRQDWEKPEVYRRISRSQVETLKSLREDEDWFADIDWRLHGQSITWRFWLIGDYAFVGSYRAYSHIGGGEKNPICMIDRNATAGQASMFLDLERYFDVNFEQAHAPDRVDDRESQMIATSRVIRDGRIKFRSGGIVTAFEEEFRLSNRVRYATCVSNGTMSIEVALRAAGVEPGDLVLVPAYDHPANLNAVRAIGANCIFADIGSDRANLDPMAADRVLEELATEGRRVSAMVVTHLDGLADVDAFEALARRYSVPLIFDAARVVGAHWDGRPVGTCGDLCTFSFEDSKHLRCGEGGAVTTDDPRLHKRLIACRNRGRDPEGEYLDVGILGSNYRMTEIQAACLRPQLPGLEHRLLRRDRNLGVFLGVLARSPHFDIPVAGRKITFTAPYNVMIRHVHETRDRNSIIDLINAHPIVQEHGIRCSRGWPTPLEVLSMTGLEQSVDLDRFPNAKRMSESAIVFNGGMLDLDPGVVDQVARQVIDIVC